MNATRAARPTMVAATPQRRAIGYLRKSRTYEGHQGEQSWHQQEEAVRRVADGYGVAELELLDDWGKSGGRKVEARRPKWQELLRAVRAGEVDVIFAYDESRLSRSALTLLELYDACAEVGVRIVLAQGGELDFRQGAGKLKLTILAGVAEYQRDQASERAFLLARHRREDGQHLGMPFYGDRPGDDWPAVVAAYEETGSFTGAARLLNERQVAAYRNGLWYAKTVRGVVRHRAPEMIPERIRRGSKESSGFMFGGIVRCPCGALMRGQRRALASGATRVRYQCHMAQTMPDHPKPAGIGEGRLLLFAIDEGMRILPAPEEVARTAHEALRVVTGEQERLTAAFVKNRVSEAEYDRQYAELAARAEAFEEAAKQETEVFRLPDAFDPGLEPREANRRLRQTWRSIQCEVGGGVMRPVRADWARPHMRGPSRKEAFDIARASSRAKVLDRGADRGR